MVGAFEDAEEGGAVVAEGVGGVVPGEAFIEDVLVEPGEEFDFVVVSAVPDGEVEGDVDAVVGAGCFGADAGVDGYGEVLHDG